MDITNVELVFLFSSQGNYNDILLVVMYKVTLRGIIDYINCRIE